MVRNQADRRKIRRSTIGAAVTLAAAAALLFSQPGFATHIQAASYTPYSWTLGRVTSTWVETNDSYINYIYPWWDAAHRQGIQNYAVQGYRYTQEMRDQYNLADNLHATGWYTTNFPSPVYDRDDDNGNGKWEETEITANYAAFPVTGATYTVGIQYSRNHWVFCCYYAWDPDGGSMSHSSQISQYYAGEWQTYRYTLPYAYHSYPYDAEGAAPVGPEAPAPMADRAVTPEVVGTSRPLTVLGMTVAATADGGETDVRVPSPGDLAAYVAAAWERGEDIIQAPGVHIGIATFTRPLQPAELSALLGTGSRLITFESIGQLSSGFTLTIGGPANDLEALGDAFKAGGARFQGVVAATVSLDEATFARLRSDTDVLVVDLTGEAIERELSNNPSLLRDLPRRLDVLMDDLYWAHAGLTR